METQISTDLANRIRQATGENVYKCYHCVKCTSGCPLAEHFDLAPNQVMRAAQLGMEDLIFSSRTPWLCASCQTCTTRCPQGIDLAKIMDFIVSEAMAKGIKPQVPEVAIFSKAFLRDVDILGRSYELGLIAEMIHKGIIDGVTTNPTLLARASGGKDAKEIFREIAEIVDGPVSAEVVGLEAETMLSEGRRLAELHPNIVIKVPLTEDGLKACRQLRAEDIGVNVTLCFSPLQALLAAKAGATFVSPFIGRLDDISHVGMDLVEEILAVYENYAFETEVLVASIRHPLHVAEAALIGADVATIPFAVIEKLAHHPLTDAGIKKFQADWDKAKK